MNKPTPPTPHIFIPDSNGYLNTKEEIYMHGAKIPHWNQDDKYNFITFRLGDSIPREELKFHNSAREYWLKTHPRPWDKKAEIEYHKRFSKRIEEWSDKGLGSCILRFQEVSSIVESTMKYRDGTIYELTDYVIMPNHIHVLVKMTDDVKVESILQEWKSVSSHRIRKLLGANWCGWMKNYHDRMIRNEEHLNNVISYIYSNYIHGGVKIGGKIYET